MIWLLIALLWIVPVALIVLAAARTPRRTVVYVGRHRPDAERAPYVERAWSVAFEARIRDRILTTTQEMILPDFDGDVGKGGDAQGDPAYRQLRTRRLDAEFVRDQRLKRLGVVPPRSPWGTPETADEWLSDRDLVGAGT